MQPSDYDEFSAYLNATAELLNRGKTLSPVAIAMWWNLLKGYDLSAVREAFDRHMRNPDTGQFMPAPADITKMIEGGTQDAALVAWAKVDLAVRSVGTYRSVQFDDPLVHRVVQDMGGWVLVGSKDDKEWPFVAKEFVNRYRGYRGRSQTPDYPPVLEGIAASQNAQLGFATEAPALIGDPARARAVGLGGVDAPTVAITYAAPPASMRLADGRRSA